MSDWRQLYPFESRYFQLPGGPRMHYLQEGRGEPVLMLHGNPTWSFFYRDLIRELRGSFRCIAPDHIGCGLSEKPGASYPYQLQQHIDNVRALIQHLGLAKFHLVVHDWGGAIGLGVASYLSEYVQSLTVLNTAAFPFASIPWRIAVCRTPVLGKLLVQGGNAFAVAATVMTTVKPLPDVVKAGYLHPYNSFANRIATHKFVLDIPMSPSHPSYPALLRSQQGVCDMAGKPVRIFWGMRDWCFHTGILAEWRKRLPHAEVSTWEDAGHYLLEDRGAQINPAIAAFLNRNKVC